MSIFKRSTVDMQSAEYSSHSSNVTVVSFLSKLRAKKVEKLRNSHNTASKQKTAYRKFPVLPIVKVSQFS
jgi:hypothetical protein